MLHAAMHTVAVLLLTWNLVDAAFRCDYVKGFEGWVKFQEIPASWQDARLRCHLEGATLASPLTVAIAENMKQFMVLNSKFKMFTGISATMSRGDLYSVEGVPISKIPISWNEGEPNNLNNKENCITLNSDNMLSDDDCDQPLPYMCYRNDDDEKLNDCGTIDDEYTLYKETGKCYKFHRVPRVWSRAFMTCSAEGGHLAIINNQMEADALKKLCDKNPISTMVGNFVKDWIYIGYYDYNEHGEWLTVHGQTLKQAGYEKWAPGQWDNYTAIKTGEFCGGIFRSALLNDMDCNQHFAFICEKDPDSLVTC